ncbi:MHYT domain-containing protein [Kitasatospora sp. McL0602]|uniref:MHYT domain-containing protein n=1 Tax=Kitasatospora sp. McL0602 TaxID=3439530 RepID=UPI003F8B61F5
MENAAYGWVTPALSYLAACLGALVALRSTRWALLTEGRARRNWLTFASVSLGGGIWTMHFIAIIGFAVSGAEVHFDILMTVLSLIVAILVVGAGIFAVGYSRRPQIAVLGGGLGTGLGVAVMHYLGMAAMRVPGDITYDASIVGASVAIAVFAATAALWATLNIRGTRAVLAASPVMGVAVCAMHYTGMTAVSVHLNGIHTASAEGVPAMKFVFPLAVGFGMYVFVSALAFAAAPSKPNAQQSAFLGRAAPLQANSYPARR